MKTLYILSKLTEGVTLSVLCGMKFRLISMVSEQFRLLSRRSLGAVALPSLWPAIAVVQGRGSY